MQAESLRLRIICNQFSELTKSEFKLRVRNEIVHLFNSTESESKAESFNCFFFSASAFSRSFAHRYWMCDRRGPIHVLRSLSTQPISMEMKWHNVRTLYSVMRVAPKERHKMLTGSHLTVCLHFNSIIVIDCGGCYGLNFAYVAVEPWLEPACYHSLLLSLFLLLLSSSFFFSSVSSLANGFLTSWYHLKRIKTLRHSRWLRQWWWWWKSATCNARQQHIWIKRPK